MMAIPSAGMPPPDEEKLQNEATLTLIALGRFPLLRDEPSALLCVRCMLEARRWQVLLGAPKSRWCLIALACLLEFAGHAAGQSPSRVDWPGVGNDPGCMRYSALDQINRASVKRLKPAWTYHTRELEGRRGKTIECTPLVIEGVMYVTTGYLRVVALDAATGEERWQFDPLTDHPFKHNASSGGVNRGCAYWSDRQPGGARRIIHGTSDGRLFSLDAKSGKLDPKFGTEGVCNLRDELDPTVAALSCRGRHRHRPCGWIRSS